MQYRGFSYDEITPLIKSIYIEQINLRINFSESGHSHD
jgi:hypothetical protein